MSLLPKIERSDISLGRVLDLVNQRAVKELDVDLNDKRAKNTRLEDKLAARIYLYMKSFFEEQCSAMQSDEAHKKRRYAHSDSEYDPDEDREPRRKISLEKKQRLINYMKKRPKEALKNVAKKYGLDERDRHSTLSKLRSLALQGATVEAKDHKYKRLWDALYQKYQEALKTNEKGVRHKDIRLWALQIADTLKVPSFGCSDTFINKWKRRYGICRSKPSRVVQIDSESDDEQFQNLLAEQSLTGA